METLVAQRKAGGIRRTAADVARITGRNLRIASRTPAVIVGGSLFPIFLLLVFTAGTGRVIAGDFDDYAQFLTPAMVVFGLQFASLAGGVALFRDIDTGMVDRMHTLPVARSAVLAGRVLSDCVVAGVQALLIIGVGTIIGFRFDNPLLVAPFLLLPVAFASAWGWLALMIAARTDAVEVLQNTISPLYLPLGFISLTFVPEAGFPTWAQPIARHNPLSEVIETMRGFASGAAAAEHLIPALGWTIGLGLLFGAGAVRALDRR